MHCMKRLTGFDGWAKLDYIITELHRFQIDLEQLVVLIDQEDHVIDEAINCLLVLFTFRSIQCFFSSSSDLIETEVNSAHRLALSEQFCDFDKDLGGQIAV